jgi:hypothetical protein
MPQGTKNLLGILMFLVIVFFQAGCTSTSSVTTSKVQVPKTIKTKLVHPEIANYTDLMTEPFIDKGFEVGRTNDPTAATLDIGFNPDLFNTTITVKLRDSSGRSLLSSEVSNKGWGTGIARSSAISKLASQTAENLKAELKKLDVTIVADKKSSDYEPNLQGAPKNPRQNISVTATKPDDDGAVVISVITGVPTLSVLIDGKDEGSNQEGTYLVKKNLNAGERKKFQVVIRLTDGRVEERSIEIERSISESSFSSASLKPSRVKRQPERDAVAIIIGIADYKSLPRADYANDDARVFYDYAIRALGVKPENIKLLVDADADEVGIYRAFKTWLPSRARSTTDVYVYYSGHGLPTPDGQGLYVLPQRADRDFVDKTAITQAEINAAIQAAKPKSVTVFLDACYSGQARTGETLLASARPVSLKAETAAFPEGFTVITASRGDQISSSSPELKHGIFSYYLMRGMEGDADANRDGRITAGEMQVYLAENVSRQAGMMNRRQEPQLIGDVNKVLVGR